MNYEQALHALYSKFPLFSQAGAKAYKVDLKNTLALCDYLGNPQNKIRCVHIAGTNGKGSTSHMLAAVFQQNKYKTGLYTSPHLKDFRERIKMNGNMIPPSFVTEFVEHTKEISGSIKPSFFEITFVMALDYFAKEKVDIAIIETGLGGRLDSTNVITPLLSVITNIGLDHVDILGDTLEKIAFEKAGIIKPKIPVVIGETTPDTRNVFTKKATETNSPIFFAEDEYKIQSAKTNDNESEIAVYNQNTRKEENYLIDLSGNYQQNNLLTALTAISILQKNIHLNEESIKEALANVKKLTGLHGRWEIIQKDPLVIMDVAHNAHGMKKLMEQIDENKFEKLHLIFGMVKDKDIEKVLELLPRNAQYYFTKAQIIRALPENELKEKAKAHGLTGHSFSNVNVALKAALEEASPNDLIVICGSVFVVGEVEI